MCTCISTEIQRLVLTDDVDLDVPNEHSKSRLGSGSLATVIVVTCLCMVLLFFGIVIACRFNVLRNNKEFQQRMNDYEAKLNTKKWSTVY